MEVQVNRTRRVPEGEGQAWPPLANKLRSFYQETAARLRALTDDPEHAQFIQRLIACLGVFFTWGLSEDGPFRPTPPAIIRTLTQSVRTAVLVFAFGLTRDGRPGGCNEELADTAIGLDVPPERVWAQWENAQAMEELFGFGLADSHVAWPPSFDAGRVRDARGLARELCESPDKNVRHVFHRLSAEMQDALRAALAAGATLDELTTLLVPALNGLLTDRDLHRGMTPFKFPALVRDLSCEMREFPSPDERQGRGTAMRNNGFILETLFAAYLTPGAYLSSLAVLDRVMEEMGKAGINDVIVVAYPGHMFRAAALTAAIARKRNLCLTVHVADTTRIKTEPGGQDWTDSFWSYDLISRGALLEWAIIEMERGLGQR
jgi:hypothetical protein